MGQSELHLTGERKRLWDKKLVAALETIRAKKEAELGKIEYGPRLGIRRNVLDQPPW